MAAVNSGVRDCPLQVMISFFDHEINLGLGSEDSFVMIGTQPFDNWYYAASGKEDDGKKKEFYGFNQDTYWPTIYLIPIDIAREAVRYFVNHQERHPQSKWDY
jgi:Immunity protein Imm1